MSPSCMKNRNIISILGRYLSILILICGCAPDQIKENVKESSQKINQAAENNNLHPELTSVESNSCSPSRENTNIETLGIQLLPSILPMERNLRASPSQSNANMYIPRLESVQNHEMNHTTIDDNGIIFHDKVYLADLDSENPQFRLNWFLVWPENSLGSPIRFAYFTHRVVSSQGEMFGSLNPRRVWHDIENHRWFISIADLFQNQSLLENYEPTLSDQQKIQLELTLEDGRHVQFSIDLQITAPLPRFESAEAELNEPLGALFVPGFLRSVVDNFMNRVPAQWSQELIQEGKVVGIETLTNPTRQRLRLWLKAGVPQITSGTIDENRGNGPIKIYSRLQRSIYVGQEQAPPRVVNQNYKSTANIAIKKVKLIRSNQGVEERIFDSTDWVDFVLNPQETVTIHWIGRVSDHERICRIPAPESNTFTWRERLEPTQIVHGFVNFYIYPGMGNNQFYTTPQEIYANHVESRQNRVELVVVELAGTWNREIRLAYPFTSSEEVTSNLESGLEMTRHFKVIKRATAGIRESQIRNYEELENYSCQGVFEAN